MTPSKITCQFLTCGGSLCGTWRLHMRSRLKMLAIQVARPTHTGILRLHWQPARGTHTVTHRDWHIRSLSRSTSSSTLNPSQAASATCTSMPASISSATHATHGMCRLMCAPHMTRHMPHISISDVWRSDTWHVWAEDYRPLILNISSWLAA